VHCTWAAWSWSESGNKWAASVISGVQNWRGHVATSPERAVYICLHSLADPRLLSASFLSCVKFCAYQSQRCCVRMTNHFDGRCQISTPNPLIYKPQNVPMWLHPPPLSTCKIWLESVHRGLLYRYVKYSDFVTLYLSFCNHQWFISVVSHHSLVMQSACVLWLLSVCTEVWTGLTDSEIEVFDWNYFIIVGSSSLIRRVLCDAHKQGKKFCVVVVDSRPKLEVKLFHTDAVCTQHLYAGTCKSILRNSY